MNINPLENDNTVLHDQVSKNADYNHKYYTKNKEYLQERAKENYLKKINRPLRRPGRKPGPVGSYKQKWIEEGRASAIVQIGSAN